MDDENNQQPKPTPGPPCTPAPKKKLRLRHDGFTPRKQRKFLKILAKTGCVRDACRGVRISTTSAYRTREKLPAFDRQWETALAMASTPIEAIAWQRGVEGVEEPVYHYGKFSHMRLRRSDSILRLLMIGSNRRKYGRAGTVAAQIGKQERERLRKQPRPELRAKQEEPPHIDDVSEKILRKVAAMRRHQLKQGYTEGPEGALLPPGWKAVRE
jgi:hypothetical protein